MDTVQLQDKLIGALIGLARATEGNTHMLTDATASLTLEGLRATDSTDSAAILDLLKRVDAEKRRLVPSCYICASPCGRNNDYDMRTLQQADPQLRELKARILKGIQDIAHAPEKANSELLYRALFAIGMDDWSEEELLPIVQELASK